MLSTLTSSAADMIQEARREQRAWMGQSLRQRLRPVRALRRLLVRDWEALCAAVSDDIQKPARETLAAELMPLAEACRFLQNQSGRLLQPRRVPLRQRPLWLFGQTDRVYRRPRGVIGIIGTWNYPLMLNGVQIVQSLTAGNAVVWKPSEVAPRSAEILYNLLIQAGFSRQLLHLMPATREAGQELADADIDHLVFTGSSNTGCHLAEHLGSRLISSSMELSGCDAMLVLEDADVNLAANAAWFGATFNRGQTCVGVRRVFVHRSIYSPFVDLLKPFLTNCQPMAMALESQVRHADSMIQDAEARGAQVLRGQQPGSGNGHETLCTVAVVIDARTDMAICREASFAPICAVVPFDTLDEALRLEGQCPYALGCSIFTGTPSRAASWANQLRAGMVSINDVIVPTAHPATPFGGHGRTGWGVTQGAEGLLEMTVQQVVSIKSGKFRPLYALARDGPSWSADVYRGLLEFGHSATIGHRLRGLWRLLRELLAKPS